MDACDRKDELFVEFKSRLACRVDACDTCLVEHPRDVVGDGIADGRIGSSRDVADGEHVPQSNVAMEDKLFLLLWRQGLWRIEQFGHKRPETILRMGVVEAVFHGLR